eukprot:TRINITY_DN1222_c0_g1_i2.p1 TRINITY_DN1222_c0_g1~~TRINITY_DN1222_c0_g1_i2.p1  ORF type:complete len:528 (+),score=173.84 TRINITY_DN1222_c0_g1_i2:79-1662(+)
MMEGSEPGSENFGRLPLNQSQERTGKKFWKINELTRELEGKTVLVRTRLEKSRLTGNLCFVTLRRNYSSIQGVISKGATTPKSMLNFIGGINKESLVDITASVVLTKEPVKECTQSDIELQIQQFFVVRESMPVKLQMEDLTRPKNVLKAQKQEIAKLAAEIQALEEKKKGVSEADQKGITDQIEQLRKDVDAATKFVKIGRSVRLDNRVLDLRTPANQAIFRIQSGVGQLFREFLISQDFVEIHTPKLMGVASEGGASVFKLGYFQTNAFLAQSPQLHKQMAITSDFERVFEIGPVFRAELSITHRHLTEFVGLDLEMAFDEHYHEVLDVFDKLFVFIFDKLNERYAEEIKAVQKQFPFEPLKYHNPSLRLTYPDAIQLLRADGLEIGDFDDMDTPTEKRLGRLVKEKYDTDFYMLDKFPAAIRPFYTMADPTNPKYANAYDFMLRGEEILSGAQRVHDPEMLVARAKERGVTEASIQDYVDAFRYGALPHAGGGIGLERVVMFFLGLDNIRSTSFFPRDPKRLTP